MLEKRKNVFVPDRYDISDNEDIPILIEEFVDDGDHHSHMTKNEKHIENEDKTGKIHKHTENYTNPNTDFNRGRSVGTGTYRYNERLRVDPNKPSNTKITTYTNASYTGEDYNDQYIDYDNPPPLSIDDSEHIPAPVMPKAKLGIQYDFDPSTLVPVEIGRMLNKGLLKNLCIPSASHAYSVGVEFFKKYILSKFDANYFKTVYIDGKHLFDDFSRINERELIKRGKPAIAFMPNIVTDFNRDGIDATLHDLNYYARTFTHKEAFFRDPEKDLYLGIELDQLLFNFAVKIKLNTRAKQLDVMRYLKIACKIGATSGFYTDMDMHVPYDMLYTLAEQVGFDVNPNLKVIKEPVKFLMYLNSHSDVPFTYKLRTINGRSEFFLRATNMYVHIRIPDISIDDGERQNQVSSNYYIEFSAEMRFPAPKIYCYFSMQHSNFMRFTEEGQLRTYIVNFSNVPETNSKGWYQLLSTSYLEEDKSKPLEVCIGDIFRSDINIMRVIDYCKEIYLSPSAFLDVKIFNNNLEMDGDIDWCKLCMTTHKKPDHELSNIVVYLNREFFNDALMTIDNGIKSRITDNQVTDNNAFIDPDKRR